MSETRICYASRGGKRHRIIYDSELAPQNKLRINSGGYVFFREKVMGKRFHRLYSRYVMNAPHGVMVDHINGNRRDNRRCNLRLCDSTVSNSHNRSGKSKVSNTGILGVSRIARGKYLAYIHDRGRQIRLGLFARRRDAIEVRIAAELSIAGDFSPRRS